MERTRVTTTAKWAERVGYSRAVRAGRHVAVSGTAPVGDDGRIAHPGDPHRQAQRCLALIVRALRQAGAEPEDVVRTRIYVADASYWEEVGRAHAEVFRHAPPATTMVVTGFIDAEILVEIEADAIID